MDGLLTVPGTKEADVYCHQTKRMSSDGQGTLSSHPGGEGTLTQGLLVRMDS